MNLHADGYGLTTRLGIGTYAYAWAIGVPGYPAPQNPLTHAEFLARAAALGVYVVQFADNLPLDILSADDLDKLLTQANQHHITVELGTRGISHDHLRRYIALAEKCHASFIRIVIDTASHHPDIPEIVETLRGIMPEFEAADLTLAIENHDRFKAAQLVEIIEQIDSPNLGICLDTVNSFGALEGPDVVIDTLGPYVVNLHVKDFTIRRLSHNMGFEVTGTPAGSGMLDTTSIIKRLHSFGRQFNAILELWPAYEGDIGQTIAKEAAWVEQSITQLRKVITT